MCPFCRASHEIPGLLFNDFSLFHLRITELGEPAPPGLAVGEAEAASACRKDANASIGDENELRVEARTSGRGELSTLEALRCSAMRRGLVMTSSR